MKGYLTNYGYMGYVDGEYLMFSCEDEYLEYMAENEQVGVQYIEKVAYCCGYGELKRHDGFQDRRKCSPEIILKNI